MITSYMEKPQISKTMFMRIENLLEDALRLINEDPKNGMDRCYKVESLAENLGESEYNRELYARVMYLMMYAHYSNKHYVEGFQYGQKAFAILEEIKKMDTTLIQVQLHRCISFIMIEMNDHEEALYHAQESMDLVRVIDNKKEKVRSLIALGLCYDRLEDYQSLLETYLVAEKEFDYIEKDNYYGNILNNLAYVYMRLNELDKAEQYIKTCLELDETRVFLRHKSTHIATYADILVAQGRLREGLVHHENALDIAVEISDIRLVSHSYLSMGLIYIKLNKYEKGLTFLKRAEAYSQRYGFLGHLYRVHETLSKVYEEQGNLAKSLHHYKKYHQYKEEHIGDYVRRRVGIQRVIYKTNRAMEDAKVANLKNKYLESQVEKQMGELLRTQDATIQTIAALAETRDDETGNHIKRTMLYVKTMCQAMMHHEDFKDEMNEDLMNLLYKSAPLHDIGKVAIPDSILLNPGKLSKEEFQVMKRHTTIGRDAMGIALESLGENSFLKIAKEIAYYHHEKWDGTGYPVGLSGEEIPLSARIMAIADVYDALISKRRYKAACSHERAVNIIVGDSHSHFDPRLVEMFLAINEKFRKIASDFADSDEEREILEQGELLRII